MKHLAFVIALFFAFPVSAGTEAWCLITTPAKTILVLGGVKTTQTYTVAERLEICSQRDDDDEDDDDDE